MPVVEPEALPSDWTSSVIEHRLDDAVVVVEEEGEEARGAWYI